jgi:hypothetical protein
MENTKRTKRLTLYVPAQIDAIRDRLEQDSGVKMSYVQVFSFLIHFYMKHANEPRTKWQPLNEGKF